MKKTKRIIGWILIRVYCLFPWYTINSFNTFFYKDELKQWTARRRPVWVNTLQLKSHDNKLLNFIARKIL